MAVPSAGQKLGLHSDVESLEFVLLTSWQQQFEEINTRSTQAMPHDLVWTYPDEQLMKRTKLIIQGTEKYSENYSFLCILFKKSTRPCLVLLPEGHFALLTHFPTPAVEQKMVIIEWPKR